MGAKSRGGWNLNLCLKECENRGEKCADCFRFSEWKEPKQTDKPERTQ